MTWDWLSWTFVARLADIVGLLAFGVTVKVLVDVRHLRNVYLFKARVPDLAKRLSEQASKLSELLNSYDKSERLIVEELAHTEVILGSLKQKTPGAVKSSSKALLGRVKKYHQRASAEELQGLYVDMRKLGAMIEELIEDLKWEQ